MAVQTAQVPARQKRKSALLGLIPAGKIERREALWFWIFISPWVIGFLAFTLYPIVMSAYYGMTVFNVASPPVWVGFENYIDLFNDRVYWKSLAGHRLLHAIERSVRHRLWLDAGGAP
ncbi:MAG: hypothetical protein RMJ55_03675 [Roseiflexaceae bacterium]|nr:hypothetical protein [Roseiflexaceae bacterium]